MAPNIDPEFVAKILSASTYLIMLWKIRTPILEFCFRVSDNMIYSKVLAELIRVEDKMEYKVIPKTFVKGKRAHP